MKKGLKNKAYRFVLMVYKITLSPFIARNASCRFYPTCSEYMTESIEKYGAKGFFMGVRRFMSCHPWSKRPPYDPVP